MTTRATIGMLASVALLLSACSSVPKTAGGGGGYYMDDGPDSSAPIDISTVPDAVPRNEPLSKSGNKPYSVFGVTTRRWRKRTVIASAVSPRGTAKNFTANVLR